MCEYCEETKTRKLLKIEAIFYYENPIAYGFPEICNWDKKAQMYICPICRQKVR